VDGAARLACALTASGSALPSGGAIRAGCLQKGQGHVPVDPAALGHAALGAL